MKAIIVDDEKLALESMHKKLSGIERIEEIYAFSNPAEALAFFIENDADVAFLDISMNTLSGLTLADAMRKKQPNLIIIFVTGYSEFSLEAFKMHADGYLMKPVDESDIERELDALTYRYPASKPEKRIRVQTFGNFEVFLNENTMVFRYAKTKEMLAYLIDRQGAACNTAELCAVLWEDKKDTPSLRSQFRNLVGDLSRILRQAGMESLFVKSRNCFAIDPEQLDCDMYRFQQGDPAAVQAYFGEYMSQYPWAEMRVGFLDAKT